MDREEQIYRLKRIFRTADYRSLAPVSKALKLIEEEICGFNLAIEAADISPATLLRARKAIAEGREVGKAGRTPLFTPIQEDELLIYLRSLPTEIPRTTQMVRQEVITEEKCLCF